MSSFTSFQWEPPNKFQNATVSELFVPIFMKRYRFILTKCTAFRNKKSNPGVKIILKRFHFRKKTCRNFISSYWYCSILLKSTVCQLFCRFLEVPCSKIHTISGWAPKPICKEPQNVLEMFNFCIHDVC